MRCLIEGCGHTTKGTGGIKHKAKSWAQEQICPCCMNELMDMNPGVFNFEYVLRSRCLVLMGMVKEEDFNGR